MLDNTARKPQVDSEPKATSHNNIKQVIDANQRAVPFSFGEKMAVLGLGIVTLVLMLTLVGIRTLGSQQQHRLQDITAAVQTSKSKNSNLRQEIGELTSSSRLADIAQQHHLKLNADRIRNISK
ncbi:cell division protein FtsL [Lactobacillus sp. DCY120]|uniref:Cell division protein FtsL n=1 Tax=Bombilactobacillus apium TaxID=2675299 RepID=A0A850R505_9LACO|nr:cell division protein FtsL [Bombilactobacillus apium]NVY95672.1 cell division protein FtsL [Bombilactobacillus apium]